MKTKPRKKIKKLINQRMHSKLRFMTAKDGNEKCICKI